MPTDPYENECEYVARGSCEYVDENDRLKAKVAELEAEVKDLAQEKAELEKEAERITS